MIETLNQIVEYFQGLVDWHPQLATFSYGDSELIQANERARTEYPLLWLETPDITYKIEEFEKHYQCFFVLLKNTKSDDWDEQHQEQHNLSIILDHLLQKIHDDHRAGELLANMKSLKAEPVFPSFGTDYCVGWRITIYLRVPLAQCPPEFN